MSTSLPEPQTLLTQETEEGQYDASAEEHEAVSRNTLPYCNPSIIDYDSMPPEMTVYTDETLPKEIKMFNSKFVTEPPFQVVVEPDTSEIQAWLEGRRLICPTATAAEGTTVIQATVEVE